ncbi:glycosyltransferase [Plesiomonas shigelloides]|uniref:glycosyltransferase family 4 protein n=1 Tax=Plesiomonas shigelloides TaxID=703 RepID=UPI0012620832|nr:glycosyltransferase family 4 protein [Plesiomonas shigelloides]KAB7692146.1 glycosyltransferase [Plesiomonas shigelloides]
MLRVLHTESSCGWGGQEIRILSESKKMIERGHVVHILACPDSNIINEANRLGIQTISLPIYKKKVGALLSVFHWLMKNHESYDVINTHSSTDAWLFSLVNSLLGHKLKIVRTRHVSTPVSNNVSTKWLYNSATDFIVTTGERLRNELHRHNGIPLQKMKSIRTGIDLNRFYPAESSSLARAEVNITEKFTVGIVATLRSWKGHEYLIRAWNEFIGENENSQLLVVGDGPQRANLEGLVKELGLSDSVIFTGNKKDPERWMRAMDIFALPSYGNEGVPQGIMQAMACGLPIISTDVGSITEAVDDGVNGIIVKVKDPKAIFGAIKFLASDYSTRKAMSEKAYAKAKDEFSLDSMVNDMETVFSKLVRK